MTRKFIITTAIAAFVGIASAPAFANSVSIQQQGWGNAAGGAQAGFHNQIGVYQDGILNGAVSQQFGNHNTSAIGQDGFNNYGETWQNGNGNAAGVGQFGANHNAILSQDGNGNVAYSGPTVFLPQGQDFLSFGVVKAPDARPQQIGLEGLFFPTFVMDETGRYRMWRDGVWFGTLQRSTGAHSAPAPARDPRSEDRATTPGR